jgi:hypothetical protein
VLGWSGANSAEFDSQALYPVVIFMPEINPSQMGGTMRLGARPTLLKPGSTIARDLYGRESKLVWERHRHRYEVNPDYVRALEDKGLIFAGVDDRAQRMEIVELPRSEHPFYFACQYHPEFQSHPHRPSPPFHGLLLAASGQLEGKLPLQGKLQRKPSVGLSQPSSPARAGEALPAVGGRPPLGPGAGAGAAPGMEVSAGGTGPSPSRPVKQTMVPAIPPTASLPPVVPADAK